MPIHPGRYVGAVGKKDPFLQSLSDRGGQGKGVNGVPVRGEFPDPSPAIGELWLQPIGIGYAFRVHTMQRFVQRLDGSPRICLYRQVRGTVAMECFRGHVDLGKARRRRKSGR